MKPQRSIRDVLADRKPKEAKPPGIKVRYRCGHESGMPEMCGACRQKRNQERARKNAERREAREKNRTVADHARLPDGALYRKVYDAGKQHWIVTLTIPGMEPIWAVGSGSFRTECEVDRLYRESLKDLGRT